MKKPQEVESIQFGAARQGVKLLGSGKADLLKSSPAPQLITFTGSFSPTLSVSLLPYGGGILPSTRKAVNMARNSTHNVLLIAQHLGLPVMRKCSTESGETSSSCL